MKTETKFTSGKWEVIVLGESAAFVSIGEDCVLEGSANGGEPLTPADAHLIAAAPLLYEALENLENDHSGIPEHAWNLVQTALKAARGEQ